MTPTATATRPAVKRAPRKRATTKKPVWKSRAVARAIEAGSAVTCVGCGEHVKFKAKVRAKQVICNVYVKGVWQRVEHYHETCYHSAGSPYGEPSD